MENSEEEIYMEIPSGYKEVYQEAEYVACSEVVKEVLFILQLLKHLGVQVQLPIRVHVDNIGAIFLAENQNSSDRTKHVDMRYHFVDNI